ncbi:hypothetical protein BaRGS_00013689 [Batillaria attramentaria]|uniref:Uncharacterized protein n=1 Tax=Batillaria attramentaria TaxID=370345 RepID=A0ABD0L6R8_9CAEN
MASIQTRVLVSGRVILTSIWHRLSLTLADNLRHSTQHFASLASSFGLSTTHHTPVHTSYCSGPLPNTRPDGTVPYSALSIGQHDCSVLEIPSTGTQATLRPTKLHRIFFTGFPGCGGLG